MEENKVMEPLNKTLPPKITKENIDPNAGTPKGVISAWLHSVVYVLVLVEL